MKTILLFCCLMIGITTIGFSQLKPLSKQEVEDLNLLYDEERLAYDIYSELTTRWDIPLFKNIAESEKRHFEYLLTIYEKYGIPVPKNNDGFYNYPEFNLKYDRFFEGGMTSLTSALTLVGQFEEGDILDLEKNIQNTQNADLLLAYRTLLEGSKNHLRAIYRNLKKQEVEYTPAFLEKRQFRQILKEMNTEDCNCIKTLKKQKHRKGKVGIN